MNAELKDSKAKAGVVNVITMAQGPPDDKAQGFAAGWRDAQNLAAGLDVSALPWANVLSAAR